MPQRARWMQQSALRQSVNRDFGNAQICCGLGAFVSFFLDENFHRRANWQIAVAGHLLFLKLILTFEHKLTGFVLLRFQFQSS